MLLTTFHLFHFRSKIIQWSEKESLSLMCWYTYKLESKNFYCFFQICLPIQLFSPFSLTIGIISVKQVSPRRLLRRYRKGNSYLYFFVYTDRVTSTLSVFTKQYDFSVQKIIFLWFFIIYSTCNFSKQW